MAIEKEGDKYVATIDVGDGLAPQKFYGDTHEELFEQLVKAQTHATKKIREQNRIIKLKSSPDQAPSTNSQEAEKARIEETAQRFMREHPNYIPCQENEEILVQYLDKRGYDFTANNLDLAYEDLKDILKLKAEAIPSAPIPAPAESRAVVRPRQASTGIPANTSVPRPSPKVGLTVEEIERMPRDEYTRKFRDPKFRELVNKAYEAARSPRT